MRVSLTSGVTAVAMAWAVVAVGLIGAQGRDEFEVASIKRNDSGEPGATIDMSRGQLRTINTPLLPLLRQAFEVMDTQIVGAPAWASTERYDIVAKVPAGFAPTDSMRPLLRALLVDRFKLATHRETRDMPVFALVRVRTDGRFGPGLREASVDCATAQPNATPPANAQDEWPNCVVRFTPGQLYVGGYPMAEVLRLLTPLVGRTILDESGITARMHVRLTYRPQGRGVPPADAADDRLDLFTAIEEQTGLKLEGRRAPVDVLVIDAIERPTPD
jgi:uncharacterized protein (TIGR03435 family)